MFPTAVSKKADLDFDSITCACLRSGANNYNPKTDGIQPKKHERMKLGSDCPESDRDWLIHRYGRPILPQQRLDQ